MNLPFGIVSYGGSKRVASRIDDYAIDLKLLYDEGFFKALNIIDVFERDYLNDFIDLGNEITSCIRRMIQEALCDEQSILAQKRQQVLKPIANIATHLPLRVGDYTDFYSCKYHAENVGRLFRPGAPPLLPNWSEMPIAYHGRSSSIIASGTAIHRPKGQFKLGKELVFLPSKKLDFELEVGVVIGKSSELGKHVSIAEANDYVFGYCLLNDWSARDIQAWEYRPLGPFLGKNFATTVSSWIVTKEALVPFLITREVESAVLPYLGGSKQDFYDINLYAELNGYRITSTNYSALGWSVAQQIAHHTINGCNLNIGDILGSGTISDAQEKGSLLEITFDGTKEVNIGGSLRSYLEDGDELVLKGYAGPLGKRVGFGKAAGRIIKETVYG